MFFHSLVCQLLQANSMAPWTIYDWSIIVYRRNTLLLGWAVLIVMSLNDQQMTTFSLLHGPSKGSQQGEGGSHQLCWKLFDANFTCQNRRVHSYLANRMYGLGRWRASVVSAEQT